MSASSRILAQVLESGLQVHVNAAVSLSGHLGLGGGGALRGVDQLGRQVDADFVEHLVDDFVGLQGGC